MSVVQNLIIGAGPAGLAVAGRLKQKKIPFRILEKSKNIANSWHQHYDRLHLHTVKSLSHLPGLKFPKHYPTYVSKGQLIQYYQDYCKTFDVQVEHDTEVKSVKFENNHWFVTTQKEKIKAAHVIFATGINRIPKEPNWEGKEQFKGNIIHSCAYKNPTPYIGKKVLIVGMGNTGAEIAYDLSEKNIETFVSVRSPVTIVPRDINGNPTQLTGRLLAKIPFGDWIGKKIASLIIGDLSSFGLEMSNLSPSKLLRTTGKTPIIDIGTAKNIKNGKIKVVDDIQSIGANSIQTKKGKTIEIDAIILATGYQASLQDFLSNTEGLLDQNGYPKSPIGRGNFLGLYFVGFDNYKLGGVLGTIYEDSKTVVEEIERT